MKTDKLNQLASKERFSLVLSSETNKNKYINIDLNKEIFKTIKK